MKKVRLGAAQLMVPAVVVGCMRFGELQQQEMNRLIHMAVEQGANFFDHADIYAGGQSEQIFGQALSSDHSLRREDVILQSKCGIRQGFYDQSKEYIINSVDGILKRLHTEYLDILLLHRPDALVSEQEVAEAFEELYQAGKVRHFGVSNHKPMQIQLLKKCVKQELLVNQLQLSIPVSNMIASGMEVNMETDGAADRDGSVLDFCRLHDITIQAWSPFQMPSWQGCFLGSEKYAKLNVEIDELAQKYNVSPSAIAAAWIFRHPADMQLIAGTTRQDRLADIIAASELVLTREEWYRLYLAAGHVLP